jgi:DNA-binding CsgD family transcriptional regulator
MSGEFVLVSQCSSLPWTSFKLDRGEGIVGRSSACDYVVRHVTISRRHAAIAVAGEVVTVRDLGSLNGTYVDGKRVTSEEVERGQRVRFGTVTFVLADERPGAELPESGKETDECREEGSSSRTQTELAELSRAQRAVLELLLDGLPDKTIASELGLSVHTVHNHVQAIYRVLDMHSRPGLLAHMLRRNGDGDGVSS